jgi:hypothetical protein
VHNGRAKIPVLLCIDVEPDGRSVDPGRPEPWSGFDATFNLIRHLRSELRARTGSPVRFSWFLRMDPQIERVYGSPGWVANRYAGWLAELGSIGDEIGLHTHAWRWDEGTGGWLVDHGNQPWVDHCVRQSFEAFRSAFGRTCQSFRFGDRWMNDATLDLVERLGARFDLTVEPGLPSSRLNEPSTSVIPDYTRAPRRPYRPARSDFRKAGRVWNRRRIWMIPMSTGNVRPLLSSGRWIARHVGGYYDSADDYHTLELALSARVFGGIVDRARRGAARLGLGRIEYGRLTFSADWPQFSATMDGLLGVSRSPYLAPVIRSGIAVHPRYQANLARNIAHILSHPLIDRFVFETPAETIERLHGPSALGVASTQPGETRPLSIP